MEPLTEKIEKNHSGDYFRERKILQWTDWLDTKYAGNGAGPVSILPTVNGKQNKIYAGGAVAHLFAFWNINGVRSRFLSGHLPCYGYYWSFIWKFFEFMTSK